MTAIGTIKYERAIKNAAGGYTYSDVTKEVEALLAEAMKNSDGFGACAVPGCDRPECMLELAIDRLKA